MSDYHRNFIHWPLAKPRGMLSAKERMILEQFYAFYPSSHDLRKAEILHVHEDDTSHVPWRVLAPIFGFGVREMKKMCGAQNDFTEAALEKEAKKRKKSLPIAPLGVPRKRERNNWGIGPRTREDYLLMKKLKKETAKLLALKEEIYCAEHVMKLTQEEKDNLPETIREFMKPKLYNLSEIKLTSEELAAVVEVIPDQVIQLPRLNL